MAMFAQVFFILYFSINKKLPYEAISIHTNHHWFVAMPDANARANGAVAGPSQHERGQLPDRFR
jgi:hypothetical protein